MAKANWVKVNPSQGSGNATVNVSSTSEHTGRVLRTTILTWKAANVADVQRTVNQAGKPEYVDIAEVLDVYPPSLATASLYEVIVLTATGEKDDPIPYTPPMEIFNGKYYTQDEALYLCTRDSGVALSHNLRDLVGIYVEVK